MPVLPRPEELTPKDDDEDVGCGAVVALVAAMIVVGLLINYFVLPLFFPY